MIGIKKTELPDRGLVVVTVELTDANLIRPYKIFSTCDANGFTRRIADFATEAAALHAHEELGQGRSAPHASHRTSYLKGSKPMSRLTLTPGLTRRDGKFKTHIPNTPANLTLLRAPLCAATAFLSFVSENPFAIRPDLEPGTEIRRGRRTVFVL